MKKQKTPALFKFFWNGIKANGRPLQRAYISPGKNLKGEWEILVRATDYDRFPEEIYQAFTVKNDTDILSDRFDKDRFIVKKDSPYFNELMLAAITGRERVLKRLEERLKKVESSPRYPYQSSFVKADIEREKDFIQRLKSTVI